RNLKHDDWVRGSAFSPRSVINRLLATASNDGKIRVWNVDVQNDALTQVFDGNTDYTIYVTFSSDDRLLASAGDDRMVYLLDRTTTSPELEGSYNTNPRARFDFRASRIRSVTFSPDGKRVAASAYDELRIWDRESGSFVVRNQAQPFTSLRFSGIPHVDKSWILTEMGPVFVGDSELTMTLPLMEPWPALASWSIDSGGEWIKYKGKEVIFLPRRYRYYPGAVFVQGSRVTIGCRSGIVMLLKFSED
ncbi:WD40-repeat-containing domain protein, partial [Xylaria flabelliformis]